MAHAVGDAHPFPIKGAHFLLVFPLLDADGDLVTGAGTPDSERSIDLGTFADCTNEITELATGSGMYYLYLTGAEMTASVVAVIAKSATGGMKTTPVVLYPRELPVLETGTAQGGGASTITLASGASAVDNAYKGLIVLCTNNSPSGVQYQARWVASSVGSTKVVTVNSPWGTEPTSSTTYSILVPETANISALLGTRMLDPNTSGLPRVDVHQWRGGTLLDVVSSRPPVLVGAVSTGAIDAAALASDLNTYQAKVALVDDNGGTADRYVVSWYKNGNLLTSGITSPTIQVIKAADASDLVASTAMTEIASASYRYVEATDRIVAGVAYIAIVAATIDGSTRSFRQPVGRDS